MSSEDKRNLPFLYDVFFVGNVCSLEIIWISLLTNGDKSRDKKLEEIHKNPVQFLHDRKGEPFFHDTQFALTLHSVHLPNITYLQRILVRSLLLVDFKHLAIDAQSQHQAGHLVFFCNGVLLDLQGWSRHVVGLS